MASRKIPLNVIQKELYQRLNGSIGVPVYNNIPDTAKPPFVQIGLFTLKRLDTKTTLSNEITTTISIFSQSKGTKEVNDIADKIVQAIESAPMDLGDGLSVVDGDLDFFECYLEDGFGYHGEISYILTVQQH